jgi:hypothetical protein
MIARSGCGPVHAPEQADRRLARRAVSLASLLVFAFGVAGCATTQGTFRPLAQSQPPKPAGVAIEVFESGAPTRPFERIARLDAHFEKTHFIHTTHEAGIAELQRQARLAGADAVIDVRETRSRVGETFILHLTGTGIVYTSGTD